MYHQSEETFAISNHVGLAPACLGIDRQVQCAALEGFCAESGARFPQLLGPGSLVNGHNPHAPARTWAHTARCQPLSGQLEMTEENLNELWPGGVIVELNRTLAGFV